MATARTFSQMSIRKRYIENRIQQTIDFDAIKASIDDMFPVKQSQVSVPTPESEVSVFCERYVEYKGEPREWLMRMPVPVEDTHPVRFARVSRALTFQGTRLNISGIFEIPDGIDPDEFVQGFVDELGLCAEAYNAAGEVVDKYVPSNPIVSFI